MTMIFVLWALIGYFVGSIPFGLVLVKMAGLGDVREIGSKSIGATNVLRTGRKDLALATVVLDATKAGIVAILAKYIAPESINVSVSLLAGSMAVIGHNFPIWLKFKGGKGVASTFGFILFTQPVVALFALLVWLVMAFTFKYSSLSALVACVATPIFAFFLTTHEYAICYLAIALLVIIRHHSNIKRLIKGEETKIGSKGKIK